MDWVIRDMMIELNRLKSLILTLYVVVIALIFILAVIGPSFSEPEEYSQQDSFDLASKVIKVVDGDTIDLASGERIRLAIVNTPERGQEGYKEAKQFTTEKCLGKDALVDIDGKQKLSYNRIVAAVYCEGVFINKELLDSGHAVVWKKFCSKSEFKLELCTSIKKKKQIK